MDNDFVIEAEVALAHALRTPAGARMRDPGRDSRVLPCMPASVSRSPTAAARSTVAVAVRGKGALAHAVSGSEPKPRLSQTAENSLPMPAGASESVHQCKFC